MVDVMEDRTAEDRPGGLHDPVMPREVITWLNLSPGACVLDATVGLGGHAALIASVIGPHGRLIGVDRDRTSLELAARRLSAAGAPYELIHDDFCHLDRVFATAGVDKVDAMLFDLGISSYQLDDPSRGFSFREEGPLDMRMDREARLSAFDLINSLSQEEIAGLLWRYGEERFARRIARRLIEERGRRPIATTAQLREVILRALPARFRRQRIHPATRSFQALRIAVNHELDSLERALRSAVPYLAVGGRICVIAFHSLEDRIVKQSFRTAEGGGTLHILTKKPLRPADAETTANPRSRSARLRAAEKV